MVKLILQKQSLLTESGYLTVKTFNLEDGESLYINSNQNDILFITRNEIKSEDYSEFNCGIQYSKSLAGNHGYLYYKDGVMYYKQLFNNNYTTCYKNETIVEPGEKIKIDLLTGYIYLANYQFRFNYNK